MGQPGEGFNSLKVILGAIPAVYANLEVCLRLCTPNSPLTDGLAGNSRCQEHG